MRQYESYNFLGENREKARSYYIPYDSIENALSGKKENPRNLTWVQVAGIVNVGTYGL